MYLKDGQTDREGSPLCVHGVHFMERKCNDPQQNKASEPSIAVPRFLASWWNYKRGARR
jgi:hypothetical protein